ncbi:Cro/CI family transcriptional regulator [Spirochaetia bacterium]|nr:Cro/CI family transcriptional regulator [Spirochaetia bacterium]
MNNRLKELRKKVGLNQLEFAKTLQMAQNSYSQIETGQTPLTEKNITLICLKFGVNEGWLRAGAGDMFIKKEMAESSEETELIGIFRRLSAEMKEFFLNMGRDLLDKTRPKEEKLPENEKRAL